MKLSVLFLAVSASVSTAFTALSVSSLKALPAPSTSDFDHQNGALLSPILIPRVPGTAGSLKVLKHFTDFFGTLPAWKVSLHNSTSTTPTSNKKLVPFRNLIATLDPPWATPGDLGRLVLVAHYDSKLTPEGFIGATDSAAPCAMLLHAARALTGPLTAKWASMSDPWDREAERGLMILLLDGEEAFETWTSTDSLYGARALAEHWEVQFHPAMSSRRTELASIDLFVLLDLLGSQYPRVPSYFATSHGAYRALARTEAELRTAGLWESQGASGETWFPDGAKTTVRMHGYSSGVEDDHIPFLHRGVEILHLIPTPFPRVWHTMDDDGAHLHAPTVRDWTRLVTAWAAGYLDVEGWVGKAVPVPVSASEAGVGKGPNVAEEQRDKQEGKIKRDAKL